VWVPPKPPEVLPAAVVRRADDAVWVAVGDDVVVYRAADSTSHVMNPQAGLLWQCLDGAASLREIFDDFADVYQVAADQVAVDFLPVVGEWLLAEIAEEVSDGHDVATSG
jgi:hypothetical protein